MSVTLQPLNGAALAKHREFSDFFARPIKTLSTKERRSEAPDALTWAGGRAVSCGRDGTLKIWRPEKQSEEKYFSGDWSGVAGNFYSDVFYACSLGGKVARFDLRVGGIVGESNVDGLDKALGIFLKEDQQELGIYTRSDAVQILDDNLEKKFPVIQLSSEVTGLCWDAQDALWVALGGREGRIRVYGNLNLMETADNVPLVLHAHQASTNCISQAGNFIVSGGADGLVGVWDSRKRACIKTFGGSTAGVTCLSTHRELVVWGCGSKEGGDSALYFAGITTGKQYLAHPTIGPVSKVAWGSENLLAYGLQNGSESGSIQFVSLNNS